VLEIEVKVRVPDLGPVRSRILTLGAVRIKERYHEMNVLYDFRDRALFKKRHALRLRTAGKKAFLTFKGEPRKSRKYKIREEYETEIKNPRHTRKILKALGFVEAFRYEKHREVFRKGTLTICLDETAAGLFIEFEGEREKIARFSQLLKIPKKDWIKLDYVQLSQNAGKEGSPSYSSSLPSPTSSTGKLSS